MNAKVLLLSVAALSMATASAEVTIQSINEKDGTPFSTIYISNGRVRMDTLHGETSGVIWKVGTKQIITLIPSKKSYMVMDADQVAAQMEQAAAQMKQVEAQMASLPPQMREMMKKNMPGMAAGKPMVDMKLTKTGKSASHGGYSCQLVDLSITGIPMMGEMGQEMCVVDPGKLGIPAADLDVLKQMAAMTQEMTKALGSVIGGMPDMTQAGGWPVWSRDKHTGDVSVVKTVSKGGVDASLFEIPAGYSEQKMPSMDGMMGGGGKKKKKKGG